MRFVFKALRRAAKQKKQNADSHTAHFRNYYIFKEEAIKAKAPPVSGVYGLYTRKRYVLIGESENIRKALLHHEKETGFRFGLSRPIGFSFEVCPAELRVQRAEQLIAEYRPVLRRRRVFPFTRSWKLAKHQAASRAARIDGAQHEDGSDPVAADQKAKRKRFYFSPDQLVAVVLGFALAAVAVGFLAILREKKTDPGKMVDPEQSVKLPGSPPLEGLGSAPDAQVQEDPSSSGTVKDGSDAAAVTENGSKKAKTQEETVEPEITESKSVAQESATTKRDSTAEPAGERSASLAAVQKESEISRAAQREKPGKTWTIQVKASLNQSSADDLAAMLKTKGYDAFIVAADVHGKTWYRVRVGPFDNRQEAESMRKLLDTREGFGDAFLARE